MNPISETKQAFLTLLEWLGEDGMPSPHAQARANTCLACPRHEEAPWEEFYKGVVADRIRRHLEMRSHLQLRVEGEEKLHLCGICRCVLSLKIHVPLDVARNNTPDWQAFPEACWLRSEKPTHDDTTTTSPTPHPSADAANPS